MSYVIAIDGPSGAGKSTVARELAKRLGYRYIDTGAMYRATALAAAREEVHLDDPFELEKFLKRLIIKQEMSGDCVVTRLGDEDVSEAIRTREAAMSASAVSALPPVRERLLVLQREMGRQGGVVMEGRDIGTVVFPDADFKFFVTASDEERARRRRLELEAKGQPVDKETILAEIRKRDHDDSTRAVAPLKRAQDAELIDCTDLSVDEVVRDMTQRIENARGGKE